MKEDLYKRINELSSLADKSFIVGISGFGGSGKSVLAKKLHESFPDSSLVEVDHFVHGGMRAFGSQWNGVDWEMFEKNVLKAIEIDDVAISYTRFDWELQKRTDEVITVPLKKIVFIEGVGLLREGFMKYFDLSVWIDCSLDIATKRGYARDRDQYGSGPEHLALWEKVWKRNDKLYFQKYRPDLLADIIYPYEK